ncbi:MAG: hypothetical protein GWP08_10950 [Nitrospiraceae bacterium]|nr:hypothetical protein [Nitrospiraceae bacterium]
MRLLAILVAACTLLMPCRARGEVMEIKVEAEEEVYTLVSPNNGSGPLWSYGCSSIARVGDEVYISQMETGEDVPLLCNTRWRLLRRTGEGWKMVDEADGYRQREPCSIATTAPDNLYMYVNDSTEPPGVKYGPCKPHLLKFTFGEALRRTAIEPSWGTKTYFTDHSYRGYAADRHTGQLLMLNIDAKTSVQHAALLSGDGKTLANGSITFPIRSCYPQVALEKGAVHVLAIGDIVEPIKEWREYKFEQTQRKWDYVFRILYHTSTPDLTKQDFAPPLEIANVDDTAGYISNQDLWINPEGAAYIMYTQREVASALMRDKFFPDKSTVNSLHLAVVENGAVARRYTLIEGNETSQPSHARFHVARDGRLWCVAYVTGPEAGMKLFMISENEPNAIWGYRPIPLKNPMSSFCLPSVRFGNAPSNTIDIFGTTGDGAMSYAQVTFSAASVG